MGSKQNRQSRRWRTFITTATAAQEQRYTLIRQCVQYCIPVCAVLHTNVCSISYQCVQYCIPVHTSQCVQYFIPVCAVFHTSVCSISYQFIPVCAVFHQCVQYLIPVHTSVYSISYQFIPLCAIFHTSSYHCVQYFITVCRILYQCVQYFLLCDNDMAVSQVLLYSFRRKTFIRGNVRDFQRARRC